MADDETDPYASIRPEAYYDDLGEEEWERLELTPKHRLEFEHTVSYLEDVLPPSGRVLDVGGGPGRYAIWLAERGYDVTMLEPSRAQRELAREKVAERGCEGVTVRDGDVRDLPVADDAADATLCLSGPLSHVVDADERERAAGELARVTRSGGPVVVSVMGLLAVVENLIRTAPEFERGLRQLPDLLETGTYCRDVLESNDVTDPTFVECHFFRAAELETLLEGAGMTVETVAGLEGPASNLGDVTEELDDDQMATVADVVAGLMEDRAVADTSEHVLAVARAD